MLWLIVVIVIVVSVSVSAIGVCEWASGSERVRGVLCAAGAWEGGTLDDINGVKAVEHMWRSNLQVRMGNM